MSLSDRSFNFSKSRRHNKGGANFMGKLFNSVLLKPVVMTIAAGIVLAGAGIVNAAATIRVLVVPFKVNAEKDFAFLQRGITEMLTSRLGQLDKVIVVTTGQPGNDIVAMAKKNRADYVVTGSLTMLDGRVSTDAQVIKGDQVNNPVLSFGRTGRQQADVIDHIDHLAGQINARILGRVPDSPNRVEAPATVLPPVAVIDPRADLHTPSPTQATSGGERSLHFKQQDTKALEPRQLLGIGNFNEQLNGLAVGDADGDGTVEIVTIGNNRLYVYRMAKGRWIKMAQFKGTGKFIGVDMADVNNNGRKEIFVTNFDNTEARVISFVMEWNGQSLERIAGKLPWYFRTVDIAERGSLLVGQKQSIGDRFTPGIYEIKWLADTYEPAERLPLPRKLNVYGFAYGAIRSPDKLEVVAYNKSGYVQLLDRKGREMSVSTEVYGGGSNAIVFTDEEQYDVQDYLFLSPRIHLHDMNGDGLQEALVVKNETSLPGGGALTRHRYYKKGRMEWLRWHGEGIRSVVKSLDVSRFIADSALVDLDGDGHLEIVAAVVKATAGVVEKGSSYVTVFKMNEPIQDPKKVMQ